MYWGELYLALAVLTVVIARLSPSLVARDCSTVLIVWVAVISQVYDVGVSETTERVVAAGVAWLVVARLSTLYIGSRLPIAVATGFALMVFWSAYASLAGVPAYEFKLGHNVIFVGQCLSVLLTAGGQWFKVRRLA